MTRGELAVGLLPESDEETRLQFLESGIVQRQQIFHGIRFQIHSIFDCDMILGQKSRQVLLAAYPHLTRLAATPDASDSLWAHLVMSVLEEYAGPCLNNWF